MNQRITSEWTNLGYCSCQFDLAEEEAIVPMWSDDLASQRG